MENEFFKLNKASVSDIEHVMGKVVMMMMMEKERDGWKIAGTMAITNLLKIRCWVVQDVLLATRECDCVFFSGHCFYAIFSFLPLIFCDPVACEHARCGVSFLESAN